MPPPTLTPIDAQRWGATESICRAREREHPPVIPFQIVLDQRLFASANYYLRLLAIRHRRETSKYRLRNLGAFNDSISFAIFLRSRTETETSRRPTRSALTSYFRARIDESPTLRLNRRSRYISMLVVNIFDEIVWEIRILCTKKTRNFGLV